MLLKATEPKPGNTVKTDRKEKGLQTYMTVASLGVLAGHDEEYMDVLTVYFKDGIVLKNTYQENAHMLEGLGK
jgi:hypothetical protein